VTALATSLCGILIAASTEPILASAGICEKEIFTGRVEVLPPCWNEQAAKQLCFELPTFGAAFAF
jgi:hypothetical protein